MECSSISAPSVKNVLGYTQEEIKVHFTEYHTDSSINHAAVGCTEQSMKGIKIPPYEVEIYHKNGNIHRLEVTEEPVLDKQGQVTAVEGIAHDITKRIFAEKTTGQSAGKPAAVSETGGHRYSGGRNCP